VEPGSDRDRQRAGGVRRQPLRGRSLPPDGGAHAAGVRGVPRRGGRRPRRARLLGHDASCRSAAWWRDRVAGLRLAGIGAWVARRDPAGRCRQDGARDLVVRADAHALPRGGASDAAGRPARRAARGRRHDLPLRAVRGGDGDDRDRAAQGRSLRSRAPALRSLRARRVARAPRASGPEHDRLHWPAREPRAGEGVYRATISAIDPAGNRSKVRRAAFRVVGGR
jgi:hypothetical protein